MKDIESDIAENLPEYLEDILEKGAILLLKSGNEFEGAKQCDSGDERLET